MIRHEQRGDGEFSFIFWRGLQFQEMKLNLVYLFVMDIPNDCFFAFAWKFWIYGNGLRIEVKGFE